MDKKQDARDEIIDVEVVGQEEKQQSYGYQTSYDTSGSGRRVTYMSMAGLGAPGHQGMSLSVFITFFLFFLCLLKWGFLAGIGYFFFWAIGSAIGVWFNMRKFLQGRLPDPWLNRIITWTVSVALVAWLS